MGDAPNSFNRPPAPPPQHFPHGSDMTMLYYGLVIVVSAAILLAVYNLIFIRWCLRQSGQPRNVFAAATDVQSFDYPSRRLLSSFRYRKESSSEQDQGRYQECAVCLSLFEDGEEVRELPRCKHSFHAPCIDMWLYSHSDCPICRARVGPSMQCHQEPVANSSPVISRELLIMESDTPV